VSVVAPAGSFDRATFETGLAVLSRRYQPSFDPSLFDQHRYLAGTDARRLSELRSAFADPATRAIFAARGGYGSMRLLARLSLEGAAPKPVVGFSDLTALHLALQSAGHVSIHGPVVTQLATQTAESVDRLFGVLELDAPPPPLADARCLVPGSVEGPLIGGNLSVLTRLLGTPHFPPIAGAILLLEDVGERPYRLDRMWTHLQLAGVFRQVAGIALGTFSGCNEEGAAYSKEDVLESLARETRLPCALGFSVGHCPANLAVPLGVQVRLIADQGRLEFLDAPTDRTQLP
jgi:muramoyltetrapeptide carboxypeptidase